MKNAIDEIITILLFQIKLLLDKEPFDVYQVQARLDILKEFRKIKETQK